MNSKFKQIGIIAGLILIIGVGFGVYGIVAKDVVPKEFKEAREKGAYFSERIVEASASLAKDLERVNQLDKDKKYTEASALITELENKNIEIKETALELAGQLEIMTRAISDIDSPEARTVALDAVNNELSVITHLLRYYDSVGSLLGVLQDKFIRNKSSQAASWIEEVNSQVVEINKYNAQAQQAFEKFDSLVK